MPTAPGSVAVHYRRSLRRAHRQCGGALVQFHCPLPTGSVAMQCNKRAAG